MKIIRSRHEDHFTIFPNALIRDPRLSWAARGLLMELLSRPQDWQTTADALARTARRERAKRGEGREAVRALFGEIESAGYIVRVKAQREDGSWATELYVYDIPQEVTSDNADNSRSDRGTGNRASASRASADRASVNRASLRSTDHGSTDERSTEEEESGELADARTRAIASDHASDDEHQAQQRREHELRRRYDLVRRMHPDHLKEVLYAFEKKRPKIYRECRQLAIKQFNREAPDAGALSADQLSYMYAVRHYADGIMPLCLSKPLGIAA